MKKWLLSAVALAALVTTRPAAAQEPKAPAAPAEPAAPVMTFDTAPMDFNDYSAPGIGFYADFGAMILKPRWSQNPAFGVEVEGLGDDDVNVVTIQDFDYNAQFVPEISVGVNSRSGLGVRLHWWGFANGNTQSIGPLLDDGVNDIEEIASATPLGLGARVDDIGGGTAGTFTALSRLRMDVWDFEVTQQIINTRWSFLLSGGVRYAHIAQKYDALAIEVDTDDQDIDGQSVLSGHNFDGAGPTLSIDARRRIGNTGLYVFSHSRGSVLFGERKRFAQEFDVDDSNDDGILDDATQSAYAQQTSASVIPVIEARIGGGWQREVGRVRIFGEAGIVGQAWFDVGNSSRATVSTEEDGDIDTDGTSLESILGLFGASLRLGIAY